LVGCQLDEEMLKMGSSGEEAARWVVPRE
jgi:hypothetical protein